MYFPKKCSIIIYANDIENGDKMVKVSVIVPAYNAEPYLDKCLESLVTQTLKDIEIIIINDGSSDKTATIIEKYKKKYKQIIFINNKKNMGIGKSRNLGIEKASGKYIGFLDSDDYVAKETYENYYNFCEKNKLELACSDYYKVFPEKIEYFKTNTFSISNIKKDPFLINKIDYGPCNKLFLRENIEKYQIRFEEHIKYEDMPFVAKALFHAQKVGHLETAYYFYRIHENSETTIMDERVFDIFTVMDLINGYYEKENKLKESLTYLNIVQITRYMLRQKYQQNKQIRKRFIDEGYQYLDVKFPGWKKNSFYKREPYLKRLVKNHKWLVNLYCIFCYSRRLK